MDEKRRNAGWVEDETGGRKRRVKEKGGKGVDLHEKAGVMRVLRIIINLSTWNVFMREVIGDGDVGSLLSVGAWARVVLVMRKVMVVCSEEQSCVFYFYLLPRQWRRWFCFEQPVERGWSGGKGNPLELVRLWSRVVRTGWLRAVTIAQHHHRNQL